MKCPHCPKEIKEYGKNKTNRDYDKHIRIHNNETKRNTSKEKKKENKGFPYKSKINQDKNKK